MKLIAFILLICQQTWAFDHDHRTYGELLSRHVKRNGAQTLVDYGAIKKDPSQLRTYVAALSKVTEKEYQQWTEEQKLAALINGYNAWTIELIVENYPVKSIKKIGPFYSTPWKQEFIEWLGEKVSLDDIEHETIRKKFKEPRIHFALVCAAMGCPTLQEKPFRASELEGQLKKASSEFLNDRNKNNYAIQGEELVLNLSSIFKWYGGDFGTEEQLRNYILEEMNLVDEAKGKQVKVNYLDYDWGLNDAK